MWDRGTSILELVGLGVLPLVAGFRAVRSWNYVLHCDSIDFPAIRHDDRSFPVANLIFHSDIEHQTEVKLTSSRVISFDCAGTLIEVNWQPEVLAADCAEALGLSFDRHHAESVYRHLLGSRWGHFRELNLQRSKEVCDAFWRELMIDWVSESCLPPESVDAIFKEADRQLFGPDSRVFRVYDDVLDVIKLLHAEGWRMAVLSNWDVSLHRTLDVHGLTPYFETVIASLEEGVEKPDSRLFHLLADRLKVRPEEIIHIGDNPLDDLQGANLAGMRGLLLNRSHTQSRPPIVHTLAALPDILKDSVHL